MTITIIVLLSFAVVMLVVLVSFLIRFNIRQEKELRHKNEVIVHEVRRNQALINRSVAGAASLFFLLVPFTAAAQTVNTESALGWYVGVEAGTALGQCTFRSISDSKTRLGVEGGVFVGYQFSTMLSADVTFTFGSQKMGANDCCPYWLGEDGNRYFAPVLDGNGWYYSDLTATTSWQRMGARIHIDLLKCIYKRGTRWSILASPQLSAFHSTNTLEANGDSEVSVGDASQWHLGLGGQLAATYRLDSHFDLGLYGGFTTLTGSRFDQLPKHGHKSNLIYDAGLRLVYHLNP